MRQDQTNAVEDFIYDINIVRNMRQVILSQVDRKMWHYFGDKVETSERLRREMVDIIIKGILTDCLIEIDEISFAKATRLLCNLLVDVDKFIGSCYLFSNHVIGDG